MPDRAWENGLHQMIEAKEEVETTAGRHTIARITYQRFFRRYLRLAGMTGTMAEAAGEIYAAFGMPTVRIPTHHPLARRNEGARLLPDEAAKWRAVAASARAHRDAGRPVLIGTRSVGASEALSAVLADEALEHLVLNARQDAREAEIVSHGGESGRITVATNMAGRGTDIKLAAAARAAGGLHVILTEFHESARIDRQLFGRSARQGDPGSFEMIVSLDDEIFRKFAGRAAEFARTWLAAHPSRTASARAGTLLRRVAQATAERHNRRIRRQTVQQDHELDRGLSFAGRAE
jgi:preprotein translocase subunit SecA